MPKFTGSGDLEQFQQGHFGFSGVRVENLGASEYTLVTIIDDTSGSTAFYKADMEACLKAIVESCAKSPRADNLMVRLVQFNQNVREVHGYKLLQDCNQGDYDNCLLCGGSTALYDAATNAIQATVAYATTLAKNDFTCNAIVFVLTDGDDNVSTETPTSVRKALEEATTGEHLESLVSVLIGVNVNNPTLASYLQKFHADAGFTQYVPLGDASPNTLAKLASFVSRSISSQSQSLGSGGPSQPLTF